MGILLASPLSRRRLLGERICDWLVGLRRGSRLLGLGQSAKTCEGRCRGCHSCGGGRSSTSSPGVRRISLCLLLRQAAEPAAESSSRPRGSVGAGGLVATSSSSVLLEEVEETPSHSRSSHGRGRPRESGERREGAGTVLNWLHISLRSTDMFRQAAGDQRLYFQPF